MPLANKNANAKISALIGTPAIMQFTEQQCQTVGELLEKTARAEDLITYSDVISHFPWLPRLEGNWTNHPLAGIFDQLDQEDARKNRPLRTSVVISKEDLRPGSGYFASLKLYRKYPGRSEKSREEAWVAELRKAYEYPWGQANDG